MNTYQIHVDTGSRLNISGANTSPVVSKINSNPFQCSILLGNRHRAFRSARLLNAQIPVGFYNIRAPYNTLTLGSTLYTVPPNNYTLPSLISYLATNVSSGFSVPSYSNAIVAYTASSSSYYMTVGSTFGIAQILGFSSGQTLNASTIYSQNPGFVNFDTYISIFIENIGSSSLEPSQITYKIPTYPNSSNVIYFNEASNFIQDVQVTDRNARVDRLNITVLDRFGNIMNNNGLDWSFSLQVDSDT